MEFKLYTPYIKKSYMLVISLIGLLMGVLGVLHFLIGEDLRVSVLTSPKHIIVSTMDIIMFYATGVFFFLISVLLIVTVVSKAHYQRQLTLIESQSEGIIEFNKKHLTLRNVNYLDYENIPFSKISSINLTVKTDGMMVLTLKVKDGYNLIGLRRYKYPQVHLHIEDYEALRECLDSVSPPIPLSFRKPIK